MKRGKMLRRAKRLELCSGMAWTQVSPSRRHSSKDSLWGANIPWKNTGPSRWLQLLASLRGWFFCTLFHELRGANVEGNIQLGKECSWFCQHLGASVSPAVQTHLGLLARHCVPKALPGAVGKGIDRRK